MVSSTGWSIAEPAWVSGNSAPGDAKTALGMRNLPTGDAVPGRQAQAPVRSRAMDGAIRAVVMVMRESQQIAAEHRGDAAHAHRVGAEHHGQEDHLTGHESSRQALEHSNQAFLHSQEEHQGTRTGPGANATAHEANQQETAALAYELWQARGCPEGSPEEDWLRALEQLRSRH